MKYVLLFFIYSFLGWSMEMVVEFHKDKKFVNRGFLIGPYCPIYGFGALLITFFLSKYQNDLFVLGVLSTFLCGTLEYVTSFLMEKIFGARWWDYSEYKFNINGRICLETVIPFGIMGCLVVKVLNPLFMNFISIINEKLLFTIMIIICTIFVIDNIVTFEIMANIKKEFSNVKKDYTERIRKKVNKVIKGKSKLHERVIKAFPDYKMIQNKIKKIRKKK